MQNQSSTIKQPLHPAIRNTLIMLASGLAASVLCAKVYAAPLGDEANPSLAVAVAAPQPGGGLR